MVKLIRNIPTYIWLVAILIIVLIIYFPAFNTFYTNDDFFHFVASRANNFQDILNFFYIPSSLTGYPHYRPLTIQIPYFIDWKLFNLNPLPFHILSFTLLSLVTILIYRFINVLSNNKFVSIFTAFLYATSASHFGHLNISAPSEIGYTFLALLAMNTFVDYLNRKKTIFYIATLIIFAISLLAKENSIIIPPLMLLTYLFHNISKGRKVEFKNMVKLLFPFGFILIGYLYIRYFKYGFASGDSYVWNFSVWKSFNTLSWYGLWSLNLPETLVDFVGPGLKLNPNLLKYFSKDMVPIFILFGIEILILAYAFIKYLINNFILSKTKKLLIHNQNFLLVSFGILWFIVALVPVLFLPLHKFTFYLALPMVGTALVISVLLKGKNVLIILFAIVWLLASIFTLKITYSTNWITQGALISKRVLNHFKSNNYPESTIVFYDTESDKGLPWLPSKLLKDSLSDNNFFKVYFDDKYKVIYGNEQKVPDKNLIKIEGRQFIGY